MRAWAAPVVYGVRQDQLEVELGTDGTTVLLHTLPWPFIQYRFEYAPGEELPVNDDLGSSAEDGSRWAGRYGGARG